MEVRLADSALADLADIVAWYTRDGAPEVGLRLTRQILERIERLADHPRLGRMVPEFGQEALRELIYPPFRIVYRRDADVLRVVRVWRGERLLRLPDDDSEDYQ